MPSSAAALRGLTVGAGEARLGVSETPHPPSRRGTSGERTRGCVSSGPSDARCPSPAPVVLAAAAAAAACPSGGRLASGETLPVPDAKAGSGGRPRGSGLGSRGRSGDTRSPRGNSGRGWVRGVVGLDELMSMSSIAGETAKLRAPKEAEAFGLHDGWRHKIPVSCEAGRPRAPPRFPGAKSPTAPACASFARLQLSQVGVEPRRRLVVQPAKLATQHWPCRCRTRACDWIHLVVVGRAGGALPCGASFSQSHARLAQLLMPVPVHCSHRSLLAQRRPNTPIRPIFSEMMAKHALVDRAAGGTPKVY